MSIAPVVSNITCSACGQPGLRITIKFDSGCPWNSTRESGVRENNLVQPFSYPPQFEPAVRAFGLLSFRASCHSARFGLTRFEKLPQTQPQPALLGFHRTL